MLTPRTKAHARIYSAKLGRSKAGAENEAVRSPWIRLGRWEAVMPGTWWGLDQRLQSMV